MKSFIFAALLASTQAIKVKTQSMGLYDGEKFEVKITQDGDNKLCETGQVATVNYTGKLKNDGTVFDSTEVKGPFSFVLGQAEVIECWDEGFKKLSVGAKATLECPAAMAYGNVMKRNIPENSDLVFDVEMLGCQNDDMADLDITELNQAVAGTETVIEEEQAAE